MEDPAGSDSLRTNGILRAFDRMEEPGNIIKRNFQWFLVLIYTVVFSYLSFIRHDDLKSYLNDLGGFDQLIWMLLNGDVAGASLRLGVHFDPILVAFVPPYAIYASPKILLFVQSLALALGGIPIYLLAREKLTSRLAASIFMGSYLLHPVIQYANLYDFHPVTLAVPLLSFAFYFLEKEKYGLLSVLVFLAIFCKEQISLIVFMFGIYILFVKKNKVVGFSVAALGLFSFSIIMGWVIPFFSPTGKHPLLYRYDWLGGDLYQISKTLLLHPLIVFATMMTWDRAIYFLLLILPLGPIPVLGFPVLLMALPDLFINSLSSAPLMHSIFFYHWSTVMPFIYFSAILGVGLIQKNWQPHAIFIYIGLMSLILWLFVSPSFPYSKNVWEATWSVSENAKLLREVKQMIPAEGSLSVQNNLGAHFSQRKYIYTFPARSESVDYVVVNIYNPYSGFRKKANFEWAIQLTISEYEQAILKLFADSEYGVLYAKDKYIIFKKGYQRDKNRSAINYFKKDMEDLKRSLE
jgi:uncharacterized membrane protein